MVTRHMKKKAFFLIFLSHIIMAISVNADTLHLKNGGEVEGIIEKEDAERVELNMGFGSATFAKNQIKRIERSSQDDNSKTVAAWEEKRSDIEKRRNEFEAERQKRFESASENWAEDARQKKLKEESETKQIQATRDEGTRSIVVEALLNEKLRVNLVLDTGASLVVLSKRVGEQLGIDVSDAKTGIMEFKLADGRRAKAKAIILESVRIQDVEVKKVMAAVMIEQISDPHLKDGLLGMSFLNRFNLKVDLKTMKITLERLK